MRGLLGWSIRTLASHLTNYYAKIIRFRFIIEIYRYLLRKCTKQKISPTIIKKVFKDRENPYNLRNANPFQPTNVNTVHNGINTVAFQGPKIWAIVPEEIKKSESLAQFKAKIKT